MLTHNGFNFIHNGIPSLGGRQRWRCAYKSKHRFQCTAKAYTISMDGIETVTFKDEHCHDAK